MEEAILHTPLGTARVQGGSEGVRSISISDTLDIPQTVPPVLEPACRQLQEYFGGRRTHFDFRLDLQGTPFQITVWNALLEIPFGQTLSYMDLAKRLGDPKAIRAVAAANGQNPLWVVVPCHRVVGSDGSLTGYAGGLHRKNWLLNHESPHPQQRLF